MKKPNPTQCNPPKTAQSMFRNWREKIIVLINTINESPAS
jgi:hypothetical protein